MNLKVVKNLSFALFFLYFFLVSIKLLEKGIKTLGAEYTDQLFESVSNPFAGLLVGILCTVLVQSSSVTTSTIVGLVGSGVLSLEYAIPMVMAVTIIVLASFGIGNPGPELYKLAEICLGAYVGGRTIEKIVAASKLGK